MNYALCFYWFLAINVAYICVDVGLHANNLYIGTTKNGTLKSQLASYDAVSFLCVVYFGLAGIVGTVMEWIDPTIARVEPMNELELYVTHPYAVTYLLHAMVAYQMWNTYICIYLKEYRSFINIIHHLLSCVTAWAILDYNFGQKHFLYFGGIVEVSTIPLTFITHFNTFPELKTKYASFHKINSVVFALSFFCARTLLWPYVSIAFWRDVINAYNASGIQSYSGLLCFSISYVIITGLQLYWSVKIASFFVK